MEILKITLGGRFAHFGINGSNDKNNRYSFQHITGSNIKGILGAIAGYGGWNQLEKNQKLPEFLEKLKDLKYAVVPKKHRFRSSIHIYNNITGVNKDGEKATPLQIHEEFLENVFWEIYLLNTPEEVKLRILENRSIYPVSLGKKGCFINSFKGEILKGETVVENRVDSIFPAEHLGGDQIFLETFDLFSEEEIFDNFIFLYSEDFFRDVRNYSLSKSLLKEKITLVHADNRNLYMIGDEL